METAPTPPREPQQAQPAASPSVAPLVPGTLYLVATPIGNLEDITLRALRVLKECTVVAAEDTRRTGQLLTHFGLRKPLISYFRFNEARRGAEILDRLRMGEIVALVTDAGTPGISDPGERVVAQVLAAGLRVESIPGACALVVGLTASGLPTESFHFAGFLPHKSGQRARRLGELGAIPGTLVLYESPFRVERLLGELQRILPGRRVVLARELTKKFEEWLRGTPAELAAEWARRPRKGEFVVMIGPAGDGQGVETAMGTEAGCGEADDTRELAGADGAGEDGVGDEALESLQG
jgi:16S rRNA (cytidine1402-2'-O)-methyltransferase